MGTEEKESQNVSQEKGKSQAASSFKKESGPLTTFRESFEKEKQPEEKIQLAIQFMKNVLSRSEGVSLKDFWDAKKLCGPVFKEQMNPIKRNHLWSEYAELAQEARRLKEIMDEQAAFSIEQIELAIEALEADMGRYEELIAQLPNLNFSNSAKGLLSKHELYDGIQRELNLLKTLISRLDSLRKEVIGTDMRISQKNRILKRLSKLGDTVFPKRKELIKQMSEQFIQDVEAFVQKRFPKEETQSEQRSPVPYYAIREEIKSFQGLAKLLTLNTHAFTKTRKMLSECWDIIKEKDKERKKEFGEKSKEQKENFVKISEKIKAYQEFCEKPENLMKDKVTQGAHEIQDEMKTLSLSRDAVRALRDEIQKIRKEALGKIEEKATKKAKEEQKKIEDFKESLSTLIGKEQELSLDELLVEEKTLAEAYESFDLSLMDQHALERQFSDIRSFVLDKKAEKASSREELETLFDERQELLEDVKTQTEIYRKELGGSGLDFEKGMTYRELYDSAKIHLDREVEALKNLEEKLV